MEHLKSNHLTKWDEETEHYCLQPQRGCFDRCKQCLNLSEADSRKNDGAWEFCTECLFCVQRAVDLLGYYEHGKVPELNVSSRKKTREHSKEGSIYEAIMASVSPVDNDIRKAEEAGVFDEPLTG